MYINLDNLT